MLDLIIYPNPRRREQELMDHKYDHMTKTPGQNRYEKKTKNGLYVIQFVHANFMEKANGYNPDSIDFLFIPSQKDLHWAWNRVLSKNGKVKVYGKEIQRDCNYRK